MGLILKNLLNWCSKKRIPIAKGITLDKTREEAFYIFLKKNLYSNKLFILLPTQKRNGPFVYRLGQKIFIL